MRIYLVLIMLTLLAGCQPIKEKKEKPILTLAWTEQQKRNYFLEHYAYNYGDIDQPLPSDTVPSREQFFKLHFPGKRHGYNDPFLYAMEEDFVDTVTSFDTSRRWIRIACVESFGTPYCLILEKKNARTYLTAKCTDVSLGAYPGQLTTSITRCFNGSGFDSICKQFGSIDLLQLPAVDSTCHGGLDGSHWSLEIIKNGKYNYLKRWTPGFCGDSSTRRLGRFTERLLEISGLKSSMGGIYSAQFLDL